MTFRPEALRKVVSMNKKKGIIIFTKDRPAILSKTLPQLLNIDLPVIVLDDSINSHTEVIAKNIAKNGKNIYYHGKIEQHTILQKFTEVDIYLNSFVKPLGSDGWTLGYARNYAIILAKMLGFERILFMDDDIIINDHSIVYKILDLLNNADFVGAEIKGMPDLSIVDHIMQKLGLEPYRFMSGGFLALKLSSVSEYFLNYYNEDWIWLFLHKPKAKLVKYGEVYQLPYDPFENAIEKALQQEFGEILVEGVKTVFEKNEYNVEKLMKKCFWTELIRKRINLIENIIHFSRKNNFDIGITVSKALLNYYFNNIEIESKFIEIFRNYFKNRKLWNNLNNYLKNKNLMEVYEYERTST